VQFTPLGEENPSRLILEQLNYHGALQVAPCLQRTEAAIKAALAGAHGLLCRPNDGIEFSPSHLELAAKPFVVGTCSAGTDHLRQLEGLPDVTIVKSAGGNAAGVAELAISHAMTLTRRLYAAERAMEMGLYEAPPGTRIEGKHWLVIGAGQQAVQLIAKAASLGVAGFTVYHDQMNDAKLIACVRMVPSELIQVTEGAPMRIKTSVKTWMTVAGTNALDEAIPQADIISLHVPARAADPLSGRPATEGMVNREFLALTKSRCFIINVARGSLVHERAVIDWLLAHSECGFASDVLDQRAERQRDPSLSVLHQEFMRSESLRDPRKRLNLVLTPHIGGSALEDFHDVCQEVLDKVLTELRIVIPAAMRRSI